MMTKTTTMKYNDSEIQRQQKTKMMKTATTGSIKTKECFGTSWLLQIWSILPVESLSKETTSNQ
jgi:hypothetical protein